MDVGTCVGSILQIRLITSYEAKALGMKVSSSLRFLSLPPVVAKTCPECSHCAKSESRRIIGIEPIKLPMQHIHVFLP